MHIIWQDLRNASTPIFLLYTLYFKWKTVFHPAAVAENSQKWIGYVYVIRNRYILLVQV